VNLALARDIAIVFLAIQAFILMLVPLVAVYFLVRGINIAGGVLPGYMKRAQSFTSTVRLRTDQTSDQIAKPILKMRRHGARIETTIRALSSEVGTTIYGESPTAQIDSTPGYQVRNDNGDSA